MWIQPKNGGRSQSRQALTEATCRGCALLWPAHGLQGCSTWDVTSSLRCGHKEEGVGVGRGQAGDHYSPGYLGLRGRRGSQCHPSRQASPNRADFAPALGCATEPMGPQLLNASVGYWNPGLTTTSLTHPMVVGATHHDLDSLVPWPGHPAREEDRGPASHCTASVPHGWNQLHFLQAWMVSVDQGNSGPGSHLSFLPIILSHWPGWDLGQEASRPAIKYQAGW